VHSEAGFRRLVAFSDAVVAIAITLLILPLVDSAGNIGNAGIGHFFHANQDRLFAFAVSFAVIGNFWWAQHQTFERLKSYNAALVWGMAVWLFSIVFLPFPTELLGSAQNGSRTVHGIYVGTMLVTSTAGLAQEWAAVRWPVLQSDEGRGTLTIDFALASTVLLGVAFVFAIAVPAVGLWGLLALLLARPIGRLLTWRRVGATSPLGS
jgi:uncharacterized membrane protein